MIGGGLFAAAILAALTAMTVRRLRSRRERMSRERALAETPGRSAGRPIPIATFAELDDAVELARCPCGGLLDRLGEAARPGLRVVRCRCITCEEEVDLFFDLRGLRH